MASLTPSPKMQFFDANGNPLASGKLYTYAAGSTTPLATYTDYGAGTPNANPVVLNSRGEASVWLGTSAYYMELKDSAGTLIWSADDINHADGATLAALAASGGSALIDFLQAGAGAVARTMQAKERDIVAIKDFGTNGGGTVDDKAAITTAQSASATFIPPGTYSVQSALALTGDFQFAPGAKLKPAAGITITVTGAIYAGMWQIFDLSAGGHVSLTGAKVQSAPVEWFGVIGGDAAFSSGNAAINKPLIDEAITYGPYELEWKRPGIYSTTGHVMGVRHKWIGLGKSVANCLQGTGIVFSDNAHMVTQGATLAGKKYVLQNGASGADQVFESFSVVGDTTDCIGLGVMPSSLAALEWSCDASDCLFKGYVGRHLGWANRNHWDACRFIGNFASTADTIWDDSSGSTTAYGYVQKQTHTSCQFEQTQVASGQIIYQDRVGSGTPGSVVIADNIWSGCDFEYGFNGVVLAGMHQSFDSPHIENLHGTFFASEGASYNSHWANAGLYKGAGTLDPGSGFAALGYLLGQLSVSSSVYPFVGASTLTLSGCTTSPTSTVDWSIDENKVVNLNVRGVSGTSNATSKTLSALPSYLWPARDKFFFFMASDNGGAYVAASGKLASADGVTTLYATANNGNWTAAGTATVNDFTLTYSRA